MPCCTQCQAAKELFDSEVAERDLRRYRKRGPNRTTQLIVQEIGRRMPANAALLDIGGGVGAIGQELLAKGIRDVTQVDASPAYLETARSAFAARGWADRSRFLEGDFVDVSKRSSPPISSQSIASFAAIPIMKTCWAAPPICHAIASH